MQRQSGQATVELALCLPLVALVLAIGFEAGGLVIDKARLWHAAREAARVAAVDPEGSRIAEAAARGGLEPLQVDVEPESAGRRAGEPVTVTLTFRPETTVPLVGGVLPDAISAAVSMRIEQP